MLCSLVRHGMTFPEPNTALADKRLFHGAGGLLVVGVLPVSLFASGHTFFVSRLHEQLGLEPYVVHATFQFSGTPGKRNRFREFMLWNDAPEYYDPGHAFVTWDNDVPEALLAAAAPNPPALACCDAQAGHFDLMNHQLLQLRHGMALASVRVLLAFLPPRVRPSRATPARRQHHLTSRSARGLSIEHFATELLQHAAPSVYAKSGHSAAWNMRYVCADCRCCAPPL